MNRHYNDYINGLCIILYSCLQNGREVVIEMNTLMIVLEIIIQQCFKVDTTIKRNKLLGLIDIIYGIVESINTSITLDLQMKLEEMYSYLIYIKYDNEERLKHLEDIINDFSSNL